ncbi:hypothetical protein AAFF_G00064850 [Aldrovandia affinis]|uniref:Uncharacterized protein n=1 Tax=Aldrovandia affinis TaxID=143900 RepID=A0AAD7T520_9TELE|nr:hypothetical protein AAFF_G00064850 [Aldrovandia affinis]
MASSSPKFTWCTCRKHKIPSKDTHEVCLHCMGIQHAKEAVLEYGKCPHCAKMDWSTCINRLTKVQEVLHRESQQRKCEAAQSEALPKPETTPSLISEAKVTTAPVPAPSAPFSTTTTALQSATLPVMFTILSPPPVQTVSSNHSVPRGAHMSPLAVQQLTDPAPSLGQPGSLVLGSHAHSRKKRCRSRSGRHSKRSHGHRRRRSPPSSSSPSPSSCCSSSGSSRSPDRRRRSRRPSRAVARLERQQRQLLEVVQQRLQAQQLAAQAQWALLERRIEALERRGAEPEVGVPEPPPTSQASTSTSSQEDGQEAEPVVWCGPSADAMATEVTALPAVIKLEEEPTSISAGLKGGSVGDGEGEEPPLLPEAPLRTQDVCLATELQALIGRAAKYLGIDFPAAPNGCACDPTMVPEFEDLVQSTWSNPTCSQPFKAAHAEMYRLHECQAAAYDRMPQVNRFMTAIFRAVKPAESKEASVPAKRWRFTETLAERVYQTAGMLARTANYLRYLSDYQKRLLLEITEDRPAQRFVAVLNELKLIAQFSLQLSSHQAELSGRAMASSVAIRRQVWMAKTNYTDALKATVADLPFVVSHALGTSAGVSPPDAACKQETS